MPKIPKTIREQVKDRDGCSLSIDLLFFSSLSGIPYRVSEDVRIKVEELVSKARDLGYDDLEFLSEEAGEGGYLPLMGSRVVSEVEQDERETDELLEREEYERLKAKFEPSV